MNDAHNSVFTSRSRWLASEMVLPGESNGKVRLGPVDGDGRKALNAKNEAEGDGVCISLPGLTWKTISDAVFTSISS